MKKNKSIFVLDTSVLVHHPDSFKCFDNASEVIIPIIVLEELDKVKKLTNEAGKNARVCIKQLDAISGDGEDLSKGIKLENGSILRIDVSSYGDIGSSDPSYGDNKILACVKNIKSKEEDVILVSRDINLRIRAKAIGVAAENYEKNKNAGIDDLYQGHCIIKSSKIGFELTENDSVMVEDYEELKHLNPNECILFKDDRGRHICPARRVGDEVRIITNKNPWQINSLNIEQLFAMELMMDNSLPLVTLSSSAGCGKTLIALACALELVINQRKFDQLLIYKPTISIGEGIGFLPGDADTKIAPFAQSNSDAFALLFGDKRGKDTWKAKLHQYIDSGVISQESISFLRGRSIPNALIIIDEMQNTTIEESKSILTRCGIGSRVFVLGDESQIDLRGNDCQNNGLTNVINAFKNSELAGHISLIKGERSPLSAAAGLLL